MYLYLDSLKILGRVYVATEGINAQVSVPDYIWNKFKIGIQNFRVLKNVPIKKAISDGDSFYKLVVKEKKEIVAYGVSDDLYDMNKVGQYLNAEQFNKAIDEGNTAVIDMRNFYETEVGRFKNAEIPKVEKSKDLLPEVRRMLNGREDHKVLLYCTGGIRCEKASSFLIKSGIKNVKQLQGGIIQYAHDIRNKDMNSRFIGKNFVFDARLGERITKDIIANCHLCGSPSDNHRDCNNDTCHILFIQCKKCEEKLSGCCSNECKDFASLPMSKQKELRKDPKRVIKKRYYRAPEISGD
tara:strand:- start:1028 stop:1918 length:891 start_codon:yes stop_codon:yes gene_type:complete